MSKLINKLKDLFPRFSSASPQVGTHSKSVLPHKQRTHPKFYELPNFTSLKREVFKQRKKSLHSPNYHFYLHSRQCLCNFMEQKKYENIRQTSVYCTQNHIYLASSNESSFFCVIFFFQMAFMEIITVSMHPKMQHK